MKTIQYDAFVVQQRSEQDAPKFVLFAASAEEIQSWALIAPLTYENLGGVQRTEVRSRVRSIARYFKSHPRNTIPTAIIVALSNAGVSTTPLNVDGQCDAGGLVRLKLEWNENDMSSNWSSRPGYVIDGQHRLKGLALADGALKIPVVGILNADKIETAFQFMVINNKASKVPPDHIRALTVIGANESDLEARLKTARLSLNANYQSVGFADDDEDSPFRKIIKWPKNEKGFVVPSAVETAIAYIRAKGGKDLEDPDAAQAFFIAIWSAINEDWADLWNGETHLLEKVGIVCLTQFITDTLKQWARNPKSGLSLTDDEQVKANARDILKGLEKMLFSAPWASTSYDTSAGRQQVSDAIDKVFDNIEEGLPWYEDVKLLPKDWVAEKFS